MSVPVSLRGLDESFDTTWRVLSADTEALDIDSYDSEFTMHFWSVCTYSDGSMKASAPDGIHYKRSATEIAKAALADTTIQYENRIVDLLMQIVSATTT